MRKSKSTRLGFDVASQQLEARRLGLIGDHPDLPVKTPGVSELRDSSVSDLSL